MKTLEELIGLDVQGLPFDEEIIMNVFDAEKPIEIMDALLPRIAQILRPEPDAPFPLRAKFFATALEAAHYQIENAELPMIFSGREVRPVNIEKYMLCTPEFFSQIPNREPGYISATLGAVMVGGLAGIDPSGCTSAEDYCDRMLHSLPLIVAGAQAIHGIAFDIEHIATPLDSRKSIHDLRNHAPLRGLATFANIPSTGLLPWYSSKELQEKLLKEKLELFDSVKIRVEEGVYKLAAFSLFKGRSVAPDPEYPLFSQTLTHLRREEFKRFSEGNLYAEYVKRTLTSRLPTHTFIDTVLRLKESSLSETLPHYLETVSKVGQLSYSKSVPLFISQYRELWTQAHTHNWLHELMLAGPIMNDILGVETGKIQQNYARLALQTSGHMINLLHNTEFRKRFHAQSLELEDYSTLEAMMHLEPEVFAQVLPYVENGDESFLRSLSNLIFAQERKQVHVTPITKKFIAGVRHIRLEDAESVWAVLDNTELAQDALDLGLTPYAGTLDSMENKVAFSTWFHGNKDHVRTEIAVLKETPKYLRGSGSASAREHIGALLRSVGSEFCSKHLTQFYDLEPVAYHRVTSVLAHVPDARTLCRSRDLVNLLKFNAVGMSPDQWDEFKQIAVKLSPSELGLKYDARLVSKGTSAAKKLRGNFEMVDAYTVAVREGKQEIVDTMLDLSDRRKLGEKVVTTLATRISEKQFGVAAYVIDQLKFGAPEPLALEILTQYQQDQDLVDVPPSELFTVYSAPQPESPVSAVETLPSFDYSAFSLYCLREGHKPELVRAFFEHGFKLTGSGRFIGSNFIPYRHVRRNVENELKLNGDAAQLDCIARWASAKGAVNDAHDTPVSVWGMSVNPRVKEVVDEPLRTYLGHVLHGSRPKIS